MPTFQEAKEKIVRMVEAYEGLSYEHISKTLPEEYRLFDVAELLKSLVSSGQLSFFKLTEHEDSPVVFVKAISSRCK